MDRAQTPGDADERAGGKADREPTSAGADGQRTDEDATREQTDGESAVRVWMVERTYARDEHNIVVTYATPDGRRYLRKSRTNRVLVDPTTAAVEVPPDRLEPVEDPERRERYAAEAERMADRHDPRDEV